MPVSVEGHQSYKLPYTGCAYVWYVHDTAGKTNVGVSM